MSWIIYIFICTNLENVSVSREPNASATTIEMSEKSKKNALETVC